MIKGMSQNLSANFCRWRFSYQCRQTLNPLYLRRHRHSAPEAKRGNPYPFPTHRHPTPHQLFHLPRNATKSDIKARYYELVRVYHPDKVTDSTSPELAQSRFQAITAAYDVLKGKTPQNADHDRPAGPSDLEARHRTTAAYRAMRQRRQELYSTGAVDDTLKDRLILAGVIMTIVFVIAHTATTRRDALADAIARNRSMSPSNQHPQTRKPTRDERRLSLDAPTNNESVKGQYHPPHE